MSRRRLVLRCALSTAFLFVVSFGSRCALAANDAAILSAARESITRDELQHHIDVLADDTLEGREAGSRGGAAAGGYLLQYFQKMSLEGGAAGGSYAQPFGSGYRNILGLLPGRDPQLKNEVILVGAHYDHVGYGTARNSYGPIGYIHNGADDNASGTSAILELIDAFHHLPEPPRRTILFALWDAEEKGLLGSHHWISEPTVPLRSVKTMVNSDMIGRLRNNRLEIYGSRTGFGFRRLVSLQNADLGLNLDFTWQLEANSDHYPFYAAGIPVLMFHTGLHADYHRPSDDADKINSQGMRLVVQLLFNTAYELAEAPTPVPFRAAARNEPATQRLEWERPLAPTAPRLGVQWTDGPDDMGGFVISHVTPGSAADRGGLRVGDRILEFAGAPVRDEKTFRLSVLAAPRHVEIRVQRSGDTPPQTLAVDLSGQPIRLGLSWRNDPAEPRAAIVSRVVAGSAAQWAGVQVADRICAVNAREFDSAEEFQRLISDSDGSVTLEIERQGQVRVVTLDAPVLAP